MGEGHVCGEYCPACDEEEKRILRERDEARMAARDLFRLWCGPMPAGAVEDHIRRFPWLMDTEVDDH